MVLQRQIVNTHRHRTKTLGTRGSPKGPKGLRLVFNRFALEQVGKLRFPANRFALGEIGSVSQFFQFYGVRYLDVMSIKSSDDPRIGTKPISHGCSPKGSRTPVIWLRTRCPNH